jgi:hypothetical protein
MRYEGRSVRSGYSKTSFNWPVRSECALNSNQFAKLVPAIRNSNASMGNSAHYAIATIAEIYYLVLRFLDSNVRMIGQGAPRVGDFRAHKLTVGMSSAEWRNTRS